MNSVSSNQLENSVSLTQLEVKKKKSCLKLKLKEGKKARELKASKINIKFQFKNLLNNLPQEWMVHMA